MFKLDDKKFRLINSFFSLTNSLPLNVFEFEDYLIFLLEEGGFKKIKKNYLFIRTLEKKLKKKIVIKEFSNNKEKLILNVFKPHKAVFLNKEEKNNRIFIQVGMLKREKESFLKNHKNLKIVKFILSNLFNKEVKILIKNLDKNGK
jgi:hypothetical protein